MKKNRTKKKKAGPESIGTILLVLFIGCALFAPFLAREDPYDIRLENRFCRPSLEHWFGCDELGRDLWSRWVYGARLSLFFACAVTVIAGSVGTFLGLFSGYVGGWIDNVIMRAVDFTLALPGLLFALAIMSILGPGIFNMALALCLTGWASYARILRGSTLSLKTAPYIQSSILSGASTVWILRSHIWPHLIRIWAVQATLHLAGLVLAEAGLSFLGLGAQPPTPSWGQMLATGLFHLMDAPHLSFFPGIGITGLVLSLFLLAQALEPERVLSTNL